MSTHNDLEYIMKKLMPKKDDSFLIKWLKIISLAVVIAFTFSIAFYIIMESISLLSIL